MSFTESSTGVCRNCQMQVMPKGAFIRAILRVGGLLHLTADTQKAVGQRVIAGSHERFLSDVLCRRQNWESV